MSKRVSRRTVLQTLGVCITLPLFESAMPRGAAMAQSTPQKKRFIGCFFGSGAPMPGGVNGDWNYAGSLSPIADLQANVAVMRGFRAVNYFDLHWSGTAGFLSGSVIKTGNPGSAEYTTCAQSLDQIIADTDPNATVRSLNVGYSHLSGWDDGHDRAASINYVNCISWRNPTTPIFNVRDANQLFGQVFGSGENVGNERLAYLIKRKQSILDGVLDQAQHQQRRLSTADKQRLDSYFTSIREIEGELSRAESAAACTRPAVVAGSEAYVNNFRTMHRIITTAMKCELTNSATIMYNDGIGQNRPTNSVARDQHTSAHDQNFAGQLGINRVQVGLWGDLIRNLRDEDLLTDTVTVLGTNMSDGRTHLPHNIPLLVASENRNDEMALGGEVVGTQAVTDVNQNRNMSDIWVDLLKLYGVTDRQLGEGVYASTGQPSGILRGGV